MNGDARLRAVRVLFVTDLRFGVARTIAVATTAADALPRGSFAVQLRSEAAVETAAARELREVTRACGALLFVNAPPAVELAAELDADGVHLGVGARGVTVSEVRIALGERALVTVPAHDDEEVRLARVNGADGVLVSPVFDTRPSKGPARGLAALRAARAIASDALAVLALGGVDGAAAASACRDAGADGVAVVRALYEAADVAGAAAALC